MIPLHTVGLGVLQLCRPAPWHGPSGLKTLVLSLAEAPPTAQEMVNHIGFGRGKPAEGGEVANAHLRGRVH